MGEMADYALDCAFDDEEEFDRLQRSGASTADLYDAGFIDESGRACRPPAIPAAPSPARPKKPKGAGPCPICGGETRRLTNRHTGAGFYGCCNFPHCRGSRDGD